MIQRNKIQQRDPEEINQQAGERNPEISPAPRNAAISETASLWNKASAVRAVLQPRAGAWLCPSCPALPLKAQGSYQNQLKQPPKSLRALPKTTLFFPLSFVALHCWDLSMISQTITELGIKSYGINKKIALMCKRRMGLMGSPQLWVLVQQVSALRSRGILAGSQVLILYG